MSELSEKIKNLSPEQKQRFLLKLNEKGLSRTSVTTDNLTPKGEISHFAKGENFAYRRTLPPDFLHTHFDRKEIIPPGKQQIQVEVKAASLNFRDLMIAMGLYPDTPGLPSVMGSDYAGIVTSVGEDVTQFKAGDRVMLLSPGSIDREWKIDPDSHFCRYQNVHQCQAFHAPDNLSFVETACIPTVFFTTYYALIILGNLKREDIVLIHSATGGVGMAALELCRWKGCTVLGTAGSPTKRDILRERGIPLAMDSRSTDFKQEVMDYTQNRGVNLVLNTLSGEGVAAGLDCLATFGHFLQLDKKDIALNQSLPLGNFNRGLSFHAIDIALLPTDEALTRHIFSELNNLFQQRYVYPIPYKVYPYYELGEALNYMSRSEHIGKLAIDFDK
jgi:NADPH:quinone reductase-like Zn-dependent oxidoreductase